MPSIVPSLVFQTRIEHLNLFIDLTDAAKEYTYVMKETEKWTMKGEMVPSKK